MVTRSRRQLRSVADPLDPAEARERFDELYRSEWTGIVALGWSLIGSWASAEELAQDAFADAYRRWDEISRLDRPGAWVRRAVINRSASFHRSRAAEQRGLERWSARAVTDADATGADRTGDSATDQVGDPAFWAAVRSLPERQMACVALHYLEDRSVAEIAEVLDSRPATVKVHLHRGRLALAQRLTGPSITSSNPSRSKSTHLAAADGDERASDGPVGEGRAGRSPSTEPATPRRTTDQTNDRPLDDRPLDDRGEEAR